MELSILFNNIGIIGVGLIGSSLARAIKKGKLANIISGYSISEETSNKALALGIIDKKSNLIDIAKDADLIIICSPPSSYENIIKEMSPYLIAGKVIISDVGSVKRFFIDLVNKYFSSDLKPFVVPAHPIAGTEKSGVEAGSAELFFDKKIIITPHENIAKESLEKIKTLWNILGSKVVELSAIKHDEIYAQISHLPQLVAYSYANLLLNNKDVISKNQSYINKEEFKRFSRICFSDPLIWVDIFIFNKRNIRNFAENFIVNFEELSGKQNKITSNSIQDKALQLLNVVPSLLACSLRKTATYLEYAGTGFKDISSYPESFRDADGVDISLCNEFVSILRGIMTAIDSNDNNNVRKKIQMGLKDIL